MTLRPALTAALLLTVMAPAAQAGDEATGTAPAPAPKVQVEIAPLPPAEPAPVLPPVPQPGPRLKATLLMHAPSGKQPTNCVIVDDGKTLLVTNRGDNSLSVFETEGMTVTKTIGELGYGAWGVHARSSEQLLVANWAGSTVALVDRVTGKRTGEVPVGMKPSYVAVSPDGKTLFTAGNFSDDVSIADIGSRRMMRQLEVGHRPMGVAVSPDGRWLYVAVCASKKIAKIDLKHEVVLENFGAPLADTTNLVISPGGRWLLAAGDSGRLLVIDTQTGDVEKIGVGSDSSAVALTPDGRVALVADYNGGSVSLVDLPAREKYASVAVGNGVIHVETDGRRFYTCNDKSSSISAYRLDPIEGTEAAPKSGM